MNAFLQTLRNDLRSDSAVLTSNDPGFVEALERWSHIDRQIPGAVVQPATVDDAITTVGLVILS